MFTQNSVTVITAATGHEKLVDCLNSVQHQTHSHLEHLVVVDGPEWEERVAEAVSQVGTLAKPLHFVRLPFPTGKHNYGGHRIYGAFSLLSNCEFVCFLDEDNSFDHDHLESLLSEIRRTNSRWAFSLRKICDARGQVLAPDNCESLGNLHPVFSNKQHFHIDTNCYLLDRQVAARCAALWYRQGRWPEGKPGPDTLLCRHLLKHFPETCSNRRHTVNYTVESQQASVRAGFFLRGNDAMQRLYPQGMPWEASVGASPSNQQV
jgi:hypothetical protein